MHDTNRGSGPDRFGWIAAVVGALVFLAVLAITLPSLSRWLDTLIVMASLFCPVIVAGLVYHRTERRGGWSHTSRLR